MKNLQIRRHRLGKIFANVLVILLLGGWGNIVTAFIHEWGHAITTLLFGGTVYEVDISTRIPHIVSNTWNLSAYQASIVALGGGLLTVFVCIVMLLVTARKVPPIFATLRFVVTCYIVIYSSQWIIKPILYHFHAMWSAPQGDDIIGFLNTSGTPWYLVTGISLLLVALCLASLHYRVGIRTILGDAIQISRTGIYFRDEKKTILVLTMLWIVVLITEPIINHNLLKYLN